MRWALLFAAIAGAGCYGDGEGLYVGLASHEARARCEPERCALARGTGVTLDIAHYISDVSETAVVEMATVDRPDVVEVALAGPGVRVRGLAAGRALVTVTAASYRGGPLELTQAIIVIDGHAQIEPRDGDQGAGARLQLLAGSDLELRLERTDDAGLPLLGDNAGPWTITPGAATVTPTGDTGLIARLVVGAPESAIISPRLRTASPARARTFEVEPEDQQVTIRAGGVTARIDLDFP